MLGVILAIGALLVGWNIIKDAMRDNDGGCLSTIGTILMILLGLALIGTVISVPPLAVIVLIGFVIIKFFTK